VVHTETPAIIAKGNTITLNSKYKKDIFSGNRPKLTKCAKNRSENEINIPPVTKAAFI